VSETEQGAIKINRLQELAVRLLKEMSVKQILDPNLDVTKNVARNEPIALIGAGAASISCASFLARLGYQNLDVYESKSQGGGLIRSEIPVNRAPKNELDFEVELMKQLGVRVHFNSKVGEDVPVESLKGKAAIFLGCGLPNPKTALGKAIYEEDNVWHSKSFLG
jgi:dihydropyrimidine dehydrogenase (NADP+)